MLLLKDTLTDLERSEFKYFISYLRKGYKLGMRTKFVWKYSTLVSYVTKERKIHEGKELKGYKLLFLI